MIFEHTASAKRWIERVQGFVDAEIRPAIPIFHEQEREPQSEAGYTGASARRQRAQ